MPPESIHEDDRDRRIQELEAEVKAMRNAEARYRGIIENMELGIMEVDSEYRQMILEDGGYQSLVEDFRVVVRMNDFVP